MRNTYTKKEDRKKKIVRLVCLILAIALGSGTVIAALYYLLNSF